MRKPEDMTHPSVLLVDDDVGMVETLGDILATSRYQVATTDSGEAAVARVQADRFDAVLMDIKMPGLNGVQALRAIKFLAPEIPVIMMTAYTRDELIAEAQQTTGFPVLVKPLDLDRVLAILSQIAPAPPERRQGAP